MFVKPKHHRYSHIKTHIVLKSAMTCYDMALKSTMTWTGLCRGIKQKKCPTRLDWGWSATGGLGWSATGDQGLGWSATEGWGLGWSATGSWDWGCSTAGGHTWVWSATGDRGQGGPPLESGTGASPPQEAKLGPVRRWWPGLVRHCSPGLGLVHCAVRIRQCGQIHSQLWGKM